MRPWSKARLSAVCAAVGIALAPLALSVDPAAGTPSYCPAYAADSLDRQLHPTGSGRRIVVIGDSYSLGVGLRDPSMAWPSMIPGRVQVFGFGGSGFSRDASLCGSDVAFARRAPEALQTDPDLVVIEGGLNDTTQPSDLIRTGFRDLLAQVGGRPTLVIGPAPAPDRVSGAARVDAILREESARAGKPYLSMLAEHYVYLGPKRLHIDLASHRAYAHRVAAALPRTQAPHRTSAPTTTSEEAPAAGAPVDQVGQPADKRLTPILIGLSIAAVLAAGTALRLLTAGRTPGRRRR